MVTILKGTVCNHRGKLTSWSNPVKIGESPLWILAQRKRHCTACGQEFTTEQRVPKNNALSRNERSGSF